MFRHKLHQDENLLQIYRKHEVTLLPTVLKIFFLLFIPWYFALKYEWAFANPVNSRIMIVWTGLIAFYTIRIFLIWFANVCIVTTKRLVYVAHTGLFRRLVTETPLDRVLNVSVQSTGFFSTLFKYGDVLVQIVGLDHPLVLKDIPNSSSAKDFIWKMHLQYGGEEETLTYTQPEIARPDKNISYAPNNQKNINNKRNV